MNDIKVQIDDTEVSKLFKNLTSSNQRNKYQLFLRDSAMLLKNESIKRLRASINTSSRQNGKSLEDGIRINNDKEMQVSVDILGDFRLKFFNSGTKIRKTRRGYNRGKITPNYFFKTANDITNSKMLNRLRYLIEESIKRISK